MSNGQQKQNISSFEREMAAGAAPGGPANQRFPSTDERNLFKQFPSE